MTLRIRPDVWKLQDWDDVLLWYARAITEMKTRPLDDPSSWRFQAGIHDYRRAGDPYAVATDQIPSASIQQRFWSQCQHSSWYFLPWHRMYLGYFERIVASTVESLGGPADWSLPYWNYSDANNPDARRIPPAFRAAQLPDGSANALHVAQRAQGVNSGDVIATVADVDIVDCLDETAFLGSSMGGNTGFGGPETGFNHGSGPVGKLEATPHGDIHVAVGGFSPAGFMSRFNTAGLDPLFWLHHANIDRLWNVWLKRRAGNSNPSKNTWLQAPGFEFHDETGAQVTLNCIDVRDSETSLFSYRYEDESDPLPPAPPATPGSLDAEEEELIMGQRPAEMVGATEAETLLTGGRVTATVQMQAPSGPAAEEDESIQPERIFINIENVKGIEPVPHLVYVNLPEGAAVSEYPHLLAGTLPMFGLPEASGEDPAHPGSGLNYALDITRLVERLGDDWSPDELRITLVPKDIQGTNVGVIAGADEEEEALPPIQIGRISIYREA